MADVFLADKRIKDAKRIVIKLGTNVITGNNGNFDYRLINQLMAQISALKYGGKEIIIVSSGAIALGNKTMGWKKTGDLTLNQCSASIGQGLLMNAYSCCSAQYGITISQLLLTYEDIQDNARKNNIKNLIERLLELGAVPIINENDSVSTEEITFGDNDILSAKVSVLASADVLILLSNVDGLYRDFGKREVIDFVGEIDTMILGCVTTEKSNAGKGGMSSKLIAAELSGSSGTITVIANGNKKNIIKRILDNENIGTLFYFDGGDSR